MQTETTDVRNDVESLIDSLKIDDAGLLVGDLEGPQIAVEYETKQGNTKRRSGQVWAYDEGRWVDRLRFSENAGEDDEDPYYIQIDSNQEMLYSVAETRDVALGQITDIHVNPQ
jgi:hypothetical protein